VSEHVHMEQIDGVTIIELRRAERRNALTPMMLQAFEQAVRTFAAQGSTRGVLIRGDGPCFCAGFDLSLCEHDAEGVVLAELLQGLSACAQAMRACPSPVVLCAHGAAIAGGCALLGGADVVVADAGAKLGYPVVTLGISPAVSAPFLARSVAHGAARARLLHPKLISGADAYAMGLVHELTDTPEQALDTATEIARTIASKPATALRATKAWLNELTPTEDAHAGLAASLALVGGDEERAFLPRVWAKK